MNLWLKYHKEVLKEEQREAALAARDRKKRSAADSDKRAEQPADASSTRLPTH